MRYLAAEPLRERLQRRLQDFAPEKGAQAALLNSLLGGRLVFNATNLETVLKSFQLSASRSEIYATLMRHWSLGDGAASAQRFVEDVLREETVVYDSERLGANDRMQARSVDAPASRVQSYSLSDIMRKRSVAVPAPFATLAATPEEWTHILPAKHTIAPLPSTRHLDRAGMARTSSSSAAFAMLQGHRPLALLARDPAMKAAHDALEPPYGTPQRAPLKQAWGALEDDGGSPAASTTAEATKYRSHLVAPFATLSINDVESEENVDTQTRRAGGRTSAKQADADPAGILCDTPREMALPMAATHSWLDGAPRRTVSRRGGVRPQSASIIQTQFGLS